MKRIIVTGVGGPAGRNFVRCLRAAPESFHIVGTDCCPTYLSLAETDAHYLVPECSSPSYVDALNEIAERECVDLLYAQPDAEVGVLSAERNRVRARMWLPAPETVRAFQDKAVSAELWCRAGLVRGEAVVVRSRADLDRAAETLGVPFWLRATEGAGARGSAPIHDPEAGWHWLAFWQAQGMDWTFMAQEYLPGREMAWPSIWKDGRLLTSLSYERLGYLLDRLTPSGKTGAASLMATRHDHEADRTAVAAVLAVDTRPDGLFCVDMCGGRDGRLVPTEVNCGRLFTASYFYQQAGANLPYAYIRAAFDEPLDD
ncbi:MAG: hypothetical protein QGI33_04235, partial [Candidatus Brocadiia bacterium]|nr:hypothetical protein [Candidatus Brocadiia bacterium]